MKWMENDFLAMDKIVSIAKSPFLSISKVNMSFLAWDKSFCPDKKYFVRPDGHNLGSNQAYLCSTYASGGIIFLLAVMLKMQTICLPVLSLSMIKTVLPSSLVMFIFRLINHFSIAISQAVMVFTYVIITIWPLVRSATMHTIFLNQTFISAKTEIVQVR